jgi:uncharacterized protein YjiS (DUF1127 family)
MTQAILTASSWIQDAIHGFADLMRARAIRKEKRASYKRTVKELRQLTDFELNDIGICRGDIHNVARGDRTIVRGIEVNENLRGSV